jgi:hypothetical protein
VEGEEGYASKIWRDLQVGDFVKILDKEVIFFILQKKTTFFEN